MFWKWFHEAEWPVAHRACAKGKTATSFGMTIDQNSLELNQVPGEVGELEA